MSWDDGKEQRENKFFMAYNQDPQRAAETDETRKARDWHKSSGDKANACSKTLGARVKAMGCQPSHGVSQ